MLDRAVMDTINGITEPILIIEVPVRHGKSTYIGEGVCSWYACRYPDRQVIYTSATGTLADRWGRRARTKVDRFGHHFGVGLNRLRSSGSDWETMQGGGMTTAGIGGSVMGRDGHFVVVDDYLRNTKDALSETIRNSQWDWWQSTLTTRMEPGAAIILMCTRWHIDDLIGRLTGESETVSEDQILPFRRIRLPAVAEAEDPLGRAVGEALWPEKWPIGDPYKQVPNADGKMTIGLAMRQRITDAYWWNAVYQQRPTRYGKATWPDSYFEDIWCGSDHGQAVR